jgi:hypothetical protein
VDSYKMGWENGGGGRGDGGGTGVGIPGERMCREGGRGVVILKDNAKCSDTDCERGKTRVGRIFFEGVSSC